MSTGKQLDSLSYERDGNVGIRIIEAFEDADEAPSWARAWA
jgi:hypothetical protein